MVTPDNLDQILMALKYAGVVHAKFGDVEFHFAPEVSAVDETAPQLELVPVATGAARGEVIGGDIVKHPGYAALFTNPPQFRPAE